jgi:uncharacterized cupin superfamily protein
MSKIDTDAIEPKRGTYYPGPFDHAAGVRLALGKAAGLQDFGVNLTRLPPSAWSSQRHWHTHEDEFIYILEGTLTLVTDAGEEQLCAGDSVGFKKNVPNGHHLVNKSECDVVYLEIGSRHPQDSCEYPDIDLRGESRGWVHKNGEPY